MSGEAGSRRIWLEEDLQDDLRWSIGVKSILHAGQSKFQAIELLDSSPFGKILMLDGKAQSSEADEFAYHENLVHPAMVMHPNPKKVFICGGGEGATAREVLRHKTVEKVVMVDIDKVVCDFCAKHLEENTAAFKDPRLELIIDDARAQLEQYPDTFDVIIGDLADPVFGGPCYQLYTDDFYKNVVSKKLAPGGVFVTQSGPCGLLSCSEVFTAIHNTLKASFAHVVPYACHIPSFADEWGWNLAFKDSSPDVSAAEIDGRIRERIGELRFLDGVTWQRMTALTKVVRDALAKDKYILSVDNPRFIFGQGVKTIV